MKTSPYSIAVETALEAGNILKKHFGKAEINNNKSRRSVDVVTKLDTDIENFIAAKLYKYDSSIGFLGEEFGERKKSNRLWLVDPIDGTAHFVRGMPFCTTMIALVENGEVVLTIINNFITKELYTAEKNKGSKLNGNPIRVSNRTLKDSYISFESNLASEKNLRTYQALNDKCILFHTINCGYEYGLIASGKIEGRICVDPFGKDWDYAPGSLLVSEAGGIVRNVGKATYDYKNHNFIATNKITYEELTKDKTGLFSA